MLGLPQQEKKNRHHGRAIITALSVFGSVTPKGAKPKNLEKGRLKSRIEYKRASRT